MFRLCAIISLLTIIAPLPGLAYTQEDADTCTPDAFRFCGHVIPDADRVASCLASNKRNVSPACKLVFSRPATAREVPTPARATGRPLDIHRRDF